MNQINTIHAHKIRPLVKIIANIIKTNPGAIDNLDYLMACLTVSIPKLKDETHCINCGAGMMEYVFKFSVLDGLLLLGMAKLVKERSKTMSFTEANQIHLPTVIGLPYTLKSRQTINSKLGLIAKKTEAGRQKHGTWVITSRGWSALRGEPIQASVKVFRGQILERNEETTTIQAVFDAYRTKKKEQSMKGKTSREYYPVDSYDRDEWVHIAGYHQGNLI